MGRRRNPNAGQEGRLEGWGGAKAVADAIEEVRGRAGKRARLAMVDGASQGYGGRE
ncbi:biotin-independent malonate decarboxylase subunit gamma, partial [Pseudomonas syringae pv. tagetis]